MIGSATVRTPPWTHAAHRRGPPHRRLPARHRERLGSGWPLRGRRGARRGGGRHRHQPGDRRPRPDRPRRGGRPPGRRGDAGHLRPGRLHALLQLPAVPDVPGRGVVGPGRPGGAAASSADAAAAGFDDALLWAAVRGDVEPPAPLEGSVPRRPPHRSRPGRPTPTASSTDASGTAGHRGRGSGIPDLRGGPMPDATTPSPLPTRGINHVALVCRDMARTVDFYTTSSASR